MSQSITYLSRLWLLLCLLPLGAAAQPAAEPALQTLSVRLAGAALKDVGAIVTALETEVGEPALPLLQALLDGELKYRVADQRLVTTLDTDDRRYQLTDILSGEALGTAGRREVRKVRSNNRIRAQIRQSIARLQLRSTDSDTRLAAARGMLGDVRADDAALLRELIAGEGNEDVREQLELALRLHQLESGSAPQRLQAAHALAGRLEPEVQNGLRALIAKDDDGEPRESDAELRAAATKALARSSDRMAFFGFLETLFFGLSLGSVLLLVAAGLAITFGVMGVINMAHGELIMLGAYSTYVVQLLMPNHIGASILVAIPVAFLMSGAVGVLIERGVIQFLKGRPLETLLATFGISLILQQAVRSIFSPLNRQVITPEWLSGSLQINPVLSLTYNRLYILVFALLVIVLLQLIMKRTSLGLKVRAVSQNRAMARAMGVRTEWVDALTFGLGSGIAGIAGVALSLITNVGPNLGQSYIIDSFMVVVFGGVGSLWGTLFGGFSLGVANKFLEPVTGAVLANILVLVFIILFIQKRPRGLFPQKGRAAE